MKRVLLTALILIFPYFVFAQQTQTKSQTQTQTRPQTQTAPAEIVVSYDTILEGTYSGVRDPLTKVITDQVEWENLWKKHVSMLVPQPPVPQVDFTNSVVVAIFSGEKHTSGYRIVVKSVAAKDPNIEVTYRETEPPKNSFTLQVLTQPFLLMRVTKPPQGSVVLVKK
jgi:hypothetical protein